MELTLKDDVNTKIAVSDCIFNYKFNLGLIHQVVVTCLSGNRKGSKSQKSRAEVSGSGKKPWRQKGTGRARAGSIRSPIWRSGGVTFAAKPKNYSQKVNKRMYRAALRSIFSELLRKNRLLIFKSFCIDTPKTKVLVSKLKNVCLKDVLIITNKIDNNLYLASRNLYKIKVQDVHYMNVLNLITFRNIICTVSAIRKIEEMLE